MKTKSLPKNKKQFIQNWNEVYSNFTLDGAYYEWPMIDKKVVKKHWESKTLGEMSAAADPMHFQRSYNSYLKDFFSK